MNWGKKQIAELSLRARAEGLSRSDDRIREEMNDRLTDDLYVVPSELK